jgi:hypothetical protein
MKPEAAPSPVEESFHLLPAHWSHRANNDCPLASGARVEVKPVILSVLYLPTLVHSPFCTIPHRWKGNAASFSLTLSLFPVTGRPTRLARGPQQTPNWGSTNDAGGRVVQGQAGLGRHGPRAVLYWTGREFERFTIRKRAWPHSSNRGHRTSARAAICLLLRQSRRHYRAGLSEACCCCWRAIMAGRRRRAGAPRKKMKDQNSKSTMRFFLQRGGCLPRR